MTVTALTDSFDLDALDTSGTFAVVTPTNGPIEIVGNFIVTCTKANVGGVSCVIQTAVDVETGISYSRAHAVAGWTAWFSSDMTEVVATPIEP